MHMISASFSKQVLNFIFTQGGFIFMPRNLLQQYFPMIRTRFEIQQIIRSNPKLNNIEGVMNMFSKELLELDRNTVQLMIDEMQNELDHRGAQLAEQKNQLNEKDAQLEYFQQTNHLYSLLANDNRSEDLKRALIDESFRDELLKSYKPE